MAVDGVRAAYDETPYESYAHPASAPENLAAIAWAYGLQPPSVGTARVLEIGCAGGGNLIPFAATHPGARTVGIDLSSVHIDQARRCVTALGLDNVDLWQGDIADLDLTSAGEFDFIICHGVYSWVSDAVQEAILRACGRLLAANGLAYVAYNTYPGWKAKEIVRDAMLLSVGDNATPAEKVTRARTMVDFLQKVAQPDSVLSRALDDYQQTAAASGDYYLLHEELELYNSPCYFTDFVNRVRQHGLDYLTEAKPEYTFAANYGPIVAGQLNEHAGNQLLLEQHLDFVVNRHFRQSLLARTDKVRRIDRDIDNKCCRRMHFAAWLPDVHAHDSVHAAAIEALNDRWPWTLSWTELVEAVRVRLAAGKLPASIDLDSRVDALLKSLIVSGHARYRLDPVSPEPSCAPIRLDEPVRRMAEFAGDEIDAYVFNKWHESVPLSPVDRFLLPLLDGRHSRDALLEAMIGVAEQGLIQISSDDGRILDDDDIRAVLAQWVDALPHRLEEMKLMSPCEYPARGEYRRRA